LLWSRGEEDAMTHPIDTDPTATPVPMDAPALQIVEHAPIRPQPKKPKLPSKKKAPLRKRRN
jgi:hypothetical protein